MRVKWIDIAKGVGILLVVVGHSSAINTGGGYVGWWINSFHMPLFYVMAGLCFSEYRYPRFWDYLKRKFLALGYPYFMLSFFMAILSIPLYWGADKTMSFVSQVLSALTIDSRISPFGFLKTLFTVEILYWVIIRCARIKWIAVSISSICAVLMLFLGNGGRYDMTVVYLGYYAVGHALSSLATKDISANRRCLCIGVGCIGVVLFSMLIAVTLPHTVGYDKMFWGNRIFFVPLSLLAIGSISLVSMASVHIKGLGGALVWLGVNSIALMAVHGHCGLWEMSWAKFGFSGVAAKFVEYVLMAFLTWALSSPIKFFVKLPKIGSKL